MKIFGNGGIEVNEQKINHEKTLTLYSSVELRKSKLFNFRERFSEIQKLYAHCRA